MGQSKERTGTGRGNGRAVLSVSQREHHWSDQVWARDPIPSPQYASRAGKVIKAPGNLELFERISRRKEK